MAKSNVIKAIRGMNDVLPLDSHIWQKIESVCNSVFMMHGYKQIKTPIIESTNLFSRSIGVDTDIVSKEMYTFEDRNGDSLTLRPEGTASCVRAGIENGLFYNQQQRLWYCGPMFRHERPQKGRYRQFHQIGAEAYGWSSVDIEAEMLSMLSQIFTQLELSNTTLQINSLGDTDTRVNYRNALIEYLQQFKSELDEDSQRRLTSNPLRILDSKNESVQNILVNAPNILDYLSDQSLTDFNLLQSYLTNLNIKYSVNSKLVRGLDYYNNTVFEWVNNDFGAQGTVCGGGRYDQMVEQLGGSSTPAFGFAMGLERLVQMLEEQNSTISQSMITPDIYIISVGELAKSQALILQQQLTIQSISTQLNCGESSMKNQFKKADKSGAKIAIIIGEDEANTTSASIKQLISIDGERGSQQTLNQNEALKLVTNLLK